jgi:GntR family transcriptional regulator
MRNRLSRESPLPLYHQIAAALRNAIAVGELGPGARLPPVRGAAREWGVNLHTVRRAYRELSDDGLVRVAGARGTVVTGAGAGGEGGAGSVQELDAFLEEWVLAGRERFGLDRVQLGQLLLRGSDDEGPPLVYLLECSRAQAAGHCRELMEAWRVDAQPLVLAEVDELPVGTLLGTYFHYNDIRQRWPGRLDEVRFVAIAPDPGLPERLSGEGWNGGRRRLLVCEFDEAKAMNIVADLTTVFPAESYTIEPRVLESPAGLPRAGSGEVVLVAPRVWAALTEEQRQKAVQIRYTMRRQDLESLGATYGWLRIDEESAR